MPNAFYASEADLDKDASDLKKYYQQKNGRWEFNDKDWPDLGDFLNPGLAANKARILQEKKDVEEALKDSQKEAKEARAEVDKLKRPGTVIISADDNQLFEKYKTIGPPADIDKKIEENEQRGKILQEKEQEEKLTNVATAAKVNIQALKDLKKLHSDIVDVKTKTSKVKDRAGKEVDQTSLIFSVKTQDNGKDVISDKSFDDFVKEKNLPKYLVDGLNDVSSTNQNQTNNRAEKTKPFIPDDLTRSVKDSKEPLTGVERAKQRARQYNQEQSTRVLPWQKQANKEE